MHPGMKHSIPAARRGPTSTLLQAAASESPPSLALLEGEVHALRVRWGWGRAKVGPVKSVRRVREFEVGVEELGPGLGLGLGLGVNSTPTLTLTLTSNSRRASTCRAPRRPSTAPATAGTSGHTSTSRCSTRSSTCCSRRWKRAPCARNRDRPRRCSLLEAVLTPCCPLIEAKLLSGCTLSTYVYIYVPISPF